MTWKNKDAPYHYDASSLVGVKGLEPSAPWSQTKYSNHTELHPDL